MSSSRELSHTAGSALERELLAALRDLMPAVDAYLMTGDLGSRALKRRCWSSEVDAARAAIAKATGTGPLEGRTGQLREDQ